MTKVFNLQGIKFGKLFVLNELLEKIIDNNRKTHLLWHCVCDCENDILVGTPDLLNGNKTNCDCKKESRIY